MRWRPTLTALAVLAVAGALVVALSSASVPTASATLDDAASEPDPEAPTALPIAAPGDLEPADGPDTMPGLPNDDRSAVDPTDGEAGEDDPPGAADPGDPDPSDTGGQAAGREISDDFSPFSYGSSGVIPTICPSPLDPHFGQHVVGETCYYLLIEGEEHEGITPQELASLEEIPFVAGNRVGSLGRPAEKIRRGPPGEAGAPRLYLTFDDGPSVRWTRPTLDLLDRYGARATFFPVGAYAQVNFHLIEEIAARGHTIGTHLWSHNEEALYSENLFRRELRASADLLGDYGTNCLRTPYGITNDQILEWAGDEGFEVVLWGDVDPLDWQAPSTDELTARILDGVQNGTILLLHERTGANTLAALDAVLGALDIRGWRFDKPICPLDT